jgi:hypothetical protein
MHSAWRLAPAFVPFVQGVIHGNMARV